MLQQIVYNTPLWVWPLLAFLIYRGLIASADREVLLTRSFIIPTVMLVISLTGIVGSFGPNVAALPIWAAGMVASTALAWAYFKDSNVVARPERRAVVLRGSWTPLVLMIGIFVTKYAVGAALSMHPALKQEGGFVITICLVYGLFNGVFIGQLMRTVAIYLKGIGRT